MDIESSTRLSLLFPLEEVRRIKNAFIQTAIQIVRCFDGHVHRIMGDAVMAYFGGPMVKPEDAAINGVNCAATLQVFAEQIVGPKLSTMGFNHEFGIRIGLDHGPEKAVLWSSYGYPGVEEVTATSFFVDVAAKLQHAASRNRSMVGGSLVDTLDFPESLVAIKRVKRDGSPVEIPFVQPNHTDQHGTAINYRQWRLSTYEYLKCTPLSSTKLIESGSIPALRVFAEVYDEDRVERQGSYFAASRIVPKNRWIKFTVAIPYLPQLPYTIRCSAKNHGTEAWNKNPVDGDAHSRDYEIRTQEQHERFSHWEKTKYRGLHYLTIEVRTSHGVQFRTTFGVYVE
ncbi:nucleotide-binding domain-containing protein [Aureliella helgolandensis]